jgi:hypothetical protein
MNRHNLKEGLVKKSKLAQCAYQEDHRAGWTETGILEIENNIRSRKYKELAHMASLTNRICEPCLAIIVLLHVAQSCDILFCFVFL